MNKKHNYVVTGISKEQVTVWKENMRDDLTLIERGDMIIPIITLTVWDACKMKVQIMIDNVRNHYGFRLVRI